MILPVEKCLRHNFLSHIHPRKASPYLRMGPGEKNNKITNVTLAQIILLKLISKKYFLCDITCSFVILKESAPSLYIK